MDFLRRLDPGHAGAAAAARPALPSPMAAPVPTPLASLNSLTSRLAASRSRRAGGLPGDLGAGSAGVAAALHEGQMAPGNGAPTASFGGVRREPIQAARLAASPTSASSESASMRAAPAVAALRPNAGRVARFAPAPAQAETSHTAHQSVAPPRQPGIEPAQAPAQPLTQRRAAAAALAPPRPAWLLAAEPGQPLSAAALQARTPDAATAMAAPAPILHVTIDRIEVRAVVAAPRPAPAQRQPKAPAVSLADYLRAGARPKAAP